MFGAFRRSLGVVLAYLLVAVLAGLLIVPLALAALAVNLATLPGLATLVLDIGLYLGGILAQIVVLLLLLGFVPWPLLLTDRGRGAWAAIREGWALTHGHRVALLSLYLALTILGGLGSLALGLGLLVTAPIAACARTALYLRLTAGQAAVVAPPTSDADALQMGAAPSAGPPTDAAVSPRHAESRPVGPSRRPCSGLVLDAWIVLLVVVAGWLSIMISSVRPIIDTLHAGWRPYGPAALLGPDIVAPLALQVAGDAPRIATAYTLTDTLGAPYFFELNHHSHVSTAVEVMALLDGGQAGGVASLGAGAIERHDSASGRVRIAVRDGSAVLAGETKAEPAATLTELMADQLAHLGAARERVAPVYDRLPKPLQQPAASPERR